MLSSLRFFNKEMDNSFNRNAMDMHKRRKSHRRTIFKKKQPLYLSAAIYAHPVAGFSMGFCDFHNFKVS